MSVRIVQLPAGALAALADGDLARAETLSPVPLSPWLASAENAGVWRRRADQVSAEPADLAWVTGVLWDDLAGVAVGRAGFHAAPDAHGMVELGYAVDPVHRRRGHARAVLDFAIRRAQDDAGVRVLRLTIAPGNVASLGLVTAYPFLRNGEQWDDEDGLELIFELPV